MDLFDIGHHPKYVGDIAQFRDRGYVTIVRVDRFERDQLGQRGIERGELAVAIGYLDA